MAHGLDLDKQLVLKWRWRPAAVWPSDRPWPAMASFCDEAAFAGITPDAKELAIFRASFAQLARETPELRFYHLVRTFNTPSRSLSVKDAKQMRYAYWHGNPPPGIEAGSRSYFWFFHDELYAALVVIEYGFDGQLRLHAERRTAEELAQRYRALCQALA